jgi:hypothetical protein
MRRVNFQKKKKKKPTCFCVFGSEGDSKKHNNTDLSRLFKSQSNRFLFNSSNIYVSSAFIWHLSYVCSRWYNRFMTCQTPANTCLCPTIYSATKDVKNHQIKIVFFFSCWYTRVMTSQTLAKLLVQLCILTQKTVKKQQNGKYKLIEISNT